MQAVVVRRFGGLEALEVIDTPVPHPGPQQVRVRVAAASVNPVDIGTRAGAFVELGMLPRVGQVGLGWDLAGVIDAAGPGVHGLAVGDAVVGLRDLIHEPLGAYAEAVVIDAAAASLAPRTTSLAAAATIPLNGLTAWQALDALDLPAGGSVLITGAAGAVGGFAVELAKLRRLRVLALARKADEELVRQLGADGFIAAGEGAAARVREMVPGGVDGVLDAAVLGGPALAAVRNGGAFVAVAPGAVPAALRGTRVELVLVRADGAQLEQLVALVDANRLTLRVASALRLTEAARAHELMAEGGLRGRLILEPAALS